MRARILLALVATACAVASPALAAHGRVGLWEITIQADLSHMVSPEQLAKMRAMGIKMPGAGDITVQHCMTASEVAMDGPPPQVTGHDKDCKMQNAKTSGQSFEADMVCSGHMQGVGHVKVSYISADHYSGQVSIDGVADGHPVKMSTSLDGRWISETCGKVTH